MPEPFRKSNAILSSWVGLGGWNTELYGGFIQAGTDAYEWDYSCQ